MAETDLIKELTDGIAYFEQILDVMPNDRTALEFLTVAYQQVGDTEKFLKYAIALTEVTLREKNLENVSGLIEKLKSVDDPRAKAAVLKLEILIAPEPELKFEKPEDRLTSATPSVAASAELKLLEKLVADGILTRSLVQAAFDQLEHLPTVEGNFLISALAILEKENLTGAAEALAAVADEAHAPPVPIDAFELVPGDIHRLSDELVKVRGVVPFSRLGNEWAVALLNPLDEDLKHEITVELNAKCHFFLALPSAIEKALERIFEDDESAAVPTSPVKAKSTPAASVEAPAVAPAAESLPEPIAPEPPPVTKPHIGIIRKTKQS